MSGVLFHACAQQMKSCLTWYTPGDRMWDLSGSSLDLEHCRLCFTIGKLLVHDELTEDQNEPQRSHLCLNNTLAINFPTGVTKPNIWLQTNRTLIAQHHIYNYIYIYVHCLLTVATALLDTKYVFWAPNCEGLGLELLGCGCVLWGKLEIACYFDTDTQ